MYLVSVNQFIFKLLSNRYYTCMHDIECNRSTIVEHLKNNDLYCIDVILELCNDCA